MVCSTVQQCAAGWRSYSFLWSALASSPAHSCVPPLITHKDPPFLPFTAFLAHDGPAVSTLEGECAAGVGWGGVGWLQGGDGSVGSGSGQAPSDINNAPTAKLLAAMRNDQQLRCLSSSAEASLRQCWLQIAITPNPLFSGCHSGITFPLS